MTKRIPEWVITRIRDVLAEYERHRHVREKLLDELAAQAWDALFPEGSGALPLKEGVARWQQARRQLSGEPDIEKILRTISSRANKKPFHWSDRPPQMLPSALIDKIEALITNESLPRETRHEQLRTAAQDAWNTLFPEDRSPGKSPLENWIRVRRWQDLMAQLGGRSTGDKILRAILSPERGEGFDWVETGELEKL